MQIPGRYIGAVYLKSQTMWFKRFITRQSVAAQTEQTAIVRPRRSWFGFMGESLTAMFILALLMCCTVFVTILWGWAQRDHFLSRMIREGVNQQFPAWNITFDTAELDHRGRVVLRHVTLNPNQSETALCVMQGMRITVDRDLLLNQRKIDIQAIEINRPKLTAVREKSGSWNWQNLPMPEGEAGAAPLIKIRDATIALQWEHADFERAIRVQIDAVDMDFTPTAQHQYQFEGVGREETLGSSKFSGTFDTLHKTWELSGELKGLQIDQPFLQAAAMISPDANRMVSQLGKSRRQTENLAQEESSSPMQNASLKLAAEEKTALVTPISQERTLETADHQFSLKLTANLRFHASCQADEDPDFSLFADLVNGQLMHPDIPMPLDQISGQIAVDRLGVRVDQIQLLSGLTSVQMTGAWGWGDEPLPETVQQEILVTLKNYQISSQTRDFLPSGLRAIYDDLKPAGQLSIVFGLKQTPDKTIDFDLFNAEVRDASICHDMFRYPVTGIQGTIVRTDHGIGAEAWALEMSGHAAGQPVKLTGNLLDPGPNYEAVFDINLNRLPIDEQFYRALQPAQHEVMSHLNLQGMADVHCVVVRKLSLGRKPIIRLKADVYDASLQVKSFPLTLRQLSGHINSDENGWQFTRLSALHGDSQVSGFGTVVPVGSEWKLNLTVAAQQARFDHDLYLALKHASKEIGQVWSMLRPRGTFGITANVEWTSGQNRAEVEIPLMKLQDCEINPTIYPWRISGINSTVSIGRNLVVAFENLKAHHDQCQIETSGVFTPHPDHWQLRFNRMVLDDLLPDHEFRAAQPEAFKNLMDMVKMHQPASLSGMLELKGDYAGQVVTAAWDTTMVLNNVDIQAGMDINSASGTLKFRGLLDRDGVVTIPEGQMSIDSCWIMGYHVTNIKGPFRVDKDQIILGSAKMFEPESPEDEWSTVTRDEQVVGRLFNGEIFLDLLAKRTNAMPYWLRCTLRRADLEQWAIQHNYGQANIKGEVNGYIDLAGDGISTRNTVGNGSILINPASLYELPVMFQMFQNLRFAPADDTAFKQAYAQFRVMDEKFVFDEIHLLGDSLNLVGKGTIRFDRTIDLDFVYRPLRRNRVNPVSQVLNRFEGVLPVLFTVEVEGTLDLPRVKVQDGVRETLKGFTRFLESGSGNALTPKIMPPPRIRVQPPAQAYQPLVSPF